MPKISIKEYKAVTAEQYERATRYQKLHQGRKTNLKYYLDAMVLIDGGLYWIDETEQAKAKFGGTK